MNERGYDVFVVHICRVKNKYEADGNASDVVLSLKD